MFYINIGWKFNGTKGMNFDDWRVFWRIKWIKFSANSNLATDVFDVKECTRENFEDFNASHIYDNLDTLDPKDEFFGKNYIKRYCFDIPKNEILPEYGDPDKNGDGTFYNRIKFVPNSDKHAEAGKFFSHFTIKYLEKTYDQNNFTDNPSKIYVRHFDKYEMNINVTETTTP